MKTVDYWSIIGIILVRGMVWAAILVTIESHNLVFFFNKIRFSREMYFYLQYIFSTRTVFFCKTSFSFFTKLSHILWLPLKFRWFHCTCIHIPSHTRATVALITTKWFFSLSNFFWNFVDFYRIFCIFLNITTCQWNT